VRKKSWVFYFDGIKNCKAKDPAPLVVIERRVIGITYPAIIPNNPLIDTTLFLLYF